MVSPARLLSGVVPLLVSWSFALPDAEPEIVLASDKRWVLNASANATVTRRDQIASFCPSPPGTEQDPILLAGYAPFAGFRQITLPFPATVVEVVFYGAVLGQIALDGDDESVYAIWDDADGDATRSVTIPRSSFNPRTKAACDIVVFDFPGITSDIHAISLDTYDKGQQIAIFNASLFTKPRTATPVATGESTSSSPTVLASQSPSSSGGSMSHSTPSSVLLASSRSPSGTPGLLDSSSGVATRSQSGDPGTPTSGGTPLRSHRSVPSRTIAIVTVSILSPLALISLYLWWRNNLKRRRTNGGLRPYLAAATQPEAAPPEEKGDKPSSIAPYSLRESSVTRVQGRGKWVRKEPETVPGGSDRSTSAGVAADEELSNEDPEQIAAIQRAVRRAGFSTQALLRSLDRVRPGPGSQDEISSTAPPHYDE